MKKQNFNAIDPRAQLPLKVTPDEIIWRLRQDWLGLIAEGKTPLLDTVIPYLEWEAIHRLRTEGGSVFTSNEPDKYEEPDHWHLWWLNEASHQCSEHDPIGRAGNHLSAIGQAAVNIIMAASGLREAIEDGKPEEAAALGMLLLCEAFHGGYSIEVEAIRATNEAFERASADRVRNTIGKTHADMSKCREACIAKAKRIWSTQPMLIGKVAEECRQGLLRVIASEPENLPSLTSKDIPDTPTIRAWLREAGSAGKLEIPPEAQKRGRPLAKK